ncbi:hydrogenase formation protein HypD [Roseomonas sp. HF4]|uniref:hydrogenase formation protein HypD n=1 Tax=Roseomonas sp. HF4 TaxID=2562313 RepID=UPI0010C12DF6|nr:hydrogenase formation protein HypD [Roseomonas sp. HF4]
MKFVDEFRDPVLARSLLREIEALAAEVSAARGRPISIMEICGGHTHAIFRFGIEGMLPPSIELIHGPGCPVCVLPMGRVDDCIALAEMPGVTLATFGDALRVPGARGSLMEAKARGLDVRTVYSPMDALAMARAEPERIVVFFGLGFETTMPSTALTVLQAERDGIRNFALFCNHITIIPTIQALLDEPDLRIDGFLGPGHVSMVIGTEPYRFVAERYARPLVVSGFEPLDVLQSLWMVLKQMREGRAEIENQYARVARDAGSRAAQDAVGRVFELREFFEWRGLGSIPHSGVRLREAFAAWDAEKRFLLPNLRVADPEACQCGDVLTGRIRPRDCRVFGTACTPATPLGALMVSSEGSCAAYHRYGALAREPASA